ncbi:MAG: hypothetical protein RL660_2059 [Bacteroidota bacterium]|jgi:hypothetical protein
MAENSSNHVVYLLEVESLHKDFLSSIRHWPNLKMATESGYIFIKGFTATQIESATLKSIPFSTIYEIKDNLLFRKGDLLPSKKMGALLWSPLERGLSITLDQFNHNFFGIQDTIEIKLAPSSIEHKAAFILIDKVQAENYIVNASAIRLKNKSWVLVNDNKVLIAGAPHLPVNGQAYWQSDKFILPVGYDFEFPILAEIIRQRISNLNYIWWQDSTTYTIIKPSSFTPLSIGSWRLTFKSPVSL